MKSKKSMNIIIAEDEEITIKHICHALKKQGHVITAAKDGLEAWTKLNTGHFDILITDIKMDKMDGMTLLEKVKAKYTDIYVIMITGYGTIDSAIEAMKKGAEEYITKPFNIDELIVKINRITEKKKIEKENQAFKVSLGLNKTMTFIVKSRKMKEVAETIKNINDSDCNILLTGETGTGKGYAAKFIHYSSHIKDKPFIEVNCAVLTEDLLANELFGHERGAFTGAVNSKPGLLEIADTGSLFLDEVSEMPLHLQSKILTVIEEGEFYRVGGIKKVKVNVRIIAATNQNLHNMIADGTFRKDLYYRLNVMEIDMPPLRERQEDINPLTEHFLIKHLAKSRKKITGFSKEALESLANYHFPGNVRELENMIERAIILEKSEKITKQNLPQTLSEPLLEVLDLNTIKPIDQLNQEYIKKVLDMVGDNKTKAAELLGISRTSLWRILKK